MSSPLKKLRYRLEWLGLIIAVKLIPLLSRRACYLAGQFIGACIAVLDRAGRRVALSNLEVAFGEQLSAQRRVQIVRESYQSFVRTMLDLVWSPRMNAENYRTWLETVNIEEALAQATAGRGVIFITFHYGNFEWAAQAIGLHGYRGMVPTREFKNPLLGPVFEKLRTHSGYEAVPREGGLLRMYKALKRGTHLALVIDLTLKPWHPSVAIDCFGLKKCVTYAHAWLHKHTGALILPVICESLGDGRYRVQIHPKIEIPPGASIVQITQACWDELERIVRERPSPWIWMYKHWRYALSGPAKPYPFYAQSARDFEMRLNQARAELEREIVE
jgi:KDO2-lipid IV(A) lauroyltransferase